MTIGKAYIKLGEHHYRENYGLSFEEFDKGQRFVHRPGITISQQDNKGDALGSLNNAQLHYDAGYAAKTEFGACLGVSTLTLQCVMGSAWKTFGRKDRIIAYDDITMRRPVYDGDTLYGESEILAVAPNPRDDRTGVVTVRTDGVNQRGETVTQVTYRVLIFRDGCHPLDAAFAAVLALPSSDKFDLHRRLHDGRLIEQIGIYFDDFEIGEVYEHFPGKTFWAEEARDHALRSLEWNPKYTNQSHIDRYCAGRSEINETFLIGAITALTTRTFGRVVANLQWRGVELPAPVFAGTTITAVSEIDSKRESKSRPDQGIIGVTTTGYNEDGNTVCRYARHLLVYRRERGPYEAAGY
jgi:itaconyl-CoA hydratase